MRILLIHLEENLKIKLKQSFAKNDIESKFLHPGDDPIEITKSFSPDLLLYYIERDMTNSDTIKTLRKKFERTGIPEVFLFSASDGEDYIEALNHGFYNIVNMPCPASFLIERLKSFSHKNSSSTQNQTLSLSLNINNTIQTVPILENDLSDFIESILMNLGQCKSSGKKTTREKNRRKEQKDSQASSIGSIEAELASALKNNELRLFYQPVVSLNGEKLSGFESLIRWAHPRNGLIGPDNFIPVAERSYLIFPIGFWVVEEACRQVRAWLDQGLIDENFRVNVNLSVRQFTHPELAERIIATVRNYKIPPSNIAFEITESAFMEDMEAANLMLLKLKSEKHLLYMDDFGTGFSSLTYLLHFPVDCIKIDKSFVKWMDVDEQSEELVKSIINLGHNLRKKVVAEGVETEEHLAILREYDCDFIQGYYYAPPLGKEEATRYISGFSQKKRYTV